MLNLMCPHSCSKKVPILEKIALINVFYLVNDQPEKQFWTFLTWIFNDEKEWPEEVLI